MSRYIRHITLNSGHRRDSRRDEVSDDAIAACTDLIDRIKADGCATLPGPAGYGVAGIAGKYTRSEEGFWRMIGRANAALVRPGRCLTTVVYRDGPPLVPLAIVSVADHRRCGGDTWANLRAHAADLGLPIVASIAPPRPPWCAALLLPGIADGIVGADVPPGHPSTWLGDFERCLAWAWIERSRSPEQAAWDELEEHALHPGGPPRPVPRDV